MIVGVGTTHRISTDPTILSSGSEQKSVLHWPQVSRNNKKEWISVSVAKTISKNRYSSRQDESIQPIRTTKCLDSELHTYIDEKITPKRIWVPPQFTTWFERIGTINPEPK